VHLPALCWISLSGIVIYADADLPTVSVRERHNDFLNALSETCADLRSKKWFSGLVHREHGHQQQK
jgi:hypothetical protein